MTRSVQITIQSGAEVQSICEQLAIDDNAIVDAAAAASSSRLVMPGENVTEQAGFMRGTGTYPDGDVLVSCIAGEMLLTNKLVTVQPLRQRYMGHVGDVVVGRISEVQQRRWKVNLSGGELRRKSLEDELKMREYLQEGDLISAEVQQTMNDGTVQLHTRSLKYGKLSQGTCLTVPASLVARLRSFVPLTSFGVELILAKNGMIFVGPTQLGDTYTGGYVQDLDRVISAEQREMIARVCNAITLLTDHSLQISETSIMRVVTEAMQREPADILHPQASFEVARIVVNQMNNAT